MNTNFESEILRARRYVGLGASAALYAVQKRNKEAAPDKRST